MKCLSIETAVLKNEWKGNKCRTMHTEDSACLPKGTETTMNVDLGFVNVKQEPVLYQASNEKV